MQDRDLVAAIVAGDPAGLAAAYDRYASALYAYCRTMLRDPEDASDALQDTFVVAAQKLDGLRDPDRLRPWLYAVARNECLRRVRGRQTMVELDQAGEVSDDGVDVDAGLREADVRSLIWAAIQGLNPSEREVFELNVRHELEGADLAAALGVPPNHAHALLSRARGQLEKSLGALLVARTGQQDCAELATILIGWDGELTALLRKRLNRHIEQCDVCGERKHRELRPEALLGALPIFLLPPGLRSSVLRLVGNVLPGGAGPGAGAGVGHGPGAGAGSHPGPTWQPTPSSGSSWQPGPSSGSGPGSGTGTGTGAGHGSGSGPAPGSGPGSGSGQEAGSGSGQGGGGGSGSGRSNQHHQHQSGGPGAGGGASLSGGWDMFALNTSALNAAEYCAHVAKRAEPFDRAGFPVALDRRRRPFAAARRKSLVAALILLLILLGLGGYTAMRFISPDTAAATIPTQSPSAAVAIVDSPSPVLIELSASSPSASPSPSQSPSPSASPSSSPAYSPSASPSTVIITTLPPTSAAPSRSPSPSPSPPPPGVLIVISPKAAPYTVDGTPVLNAEGGFVDYAGEVVIMAKGGTVANYDVVVPTPRRGSPFASPAAGGPLPAGASATITIGTLTTLAQAPIVFTINPGNIQILFYAPLD